jgi:hypothetical protein
VAFKYSRSNQFRFHAAKKAIEAEQVMTIIRLLVLVFLLVTGSTPFCAPASASPITTMADCPAMADTGSSKSDSKQMGSNIICHACAISVGDATPLPSPAIWGKSETVGLRLTQLESKTQSPPTPPPKIG